MIRSLPPRLVVTCILPFLVIFLPTTISLSDFYGRFTDDSTRKIFLLFLSVRLPYCSESTRYKVLRNVPVPYLQFVALRGITLPSRFLRRMKSVTWLHELQPSNSLLYLPSHVRFLHLHIMFRSQFSFLDIVAQVLPNLNRLYLNYARGGPYFYQGVLETTIFNFENLEELSIFSKQNGYPRRLLIGNCPRLRGITISKWIITREFFESILSCKSLQELVFLNCTFLDGVSKNSESYGSLATVKFIETEI